MLHRRRAAEDRAAALQAARAEGQAAAEAHAELENTINLLKTQLAEAESAVEQAKAETDHLRSSGEDATRSSQEALASAEAQRVAVEEELRAARSCVSGTPVSPAVHFMSSAVPFTSLRHAWPT